MKAAARKIRSGTRHKANGRGNAVRSRLPRKFKKKSTHGTRKKRSSGREQQLKKVFVEAVSDAHARWVWLE